MLISMYSCIESMANNVEYMENRAISRCSNKQSLFYSSEKDLDIAVFDE